MVGRINLSTKLLEVRPRPSGQPFLCVCECVSDSKMEGRKESHVEGLSNQKDQNKHLI